MGYVPHTTYLCQGLDVVLFFPHKCVFAEHANHKQETGQTLGSCMCVTPSTIPAAFCKTDIWPFNPTVITKKMPAPSPSTSLQPTQVFLIVQPSPIQKVLETIWGSHAPPLAITSPPVAHPPSSSPPLTPSPYYFPNAVHKSAAFAMEQDLIATSPLSSFHMTGVCPGLSSIHLEVMNISLQGFLNVFSDQNALQGFPLLVIPLNCSLNILPLWGKKVYIFITFIVPSIKLLHLPSNPYSSCCQTIYLNEVHWIQIHYHYHCCDAYHPHEAIPQPNKRFPVKETLQSCTDLRLGEPWAGEFQLVKGTYLDVFKGFILLVYCSPFVPFKWS